LDLWNDMTHHKYLYDKEQKLSSNNRDCQRADHTPYDNEAAP
jgi:hypothetical protein